MRLTCVISSLAPGGAERVMSLLCSAWSARGHRVTLVTTASRTPDFLPLSGAVGRVRLAALPLPPGRPFAPIRAADRIAKLRRALLSTAPDVAVAFLDLTNVATLLAAAGREIPVVVSERVDPNFRTLHAPGRIARRVTYPWAAATVVQTERVRKWFRGRLPSWKIEVIPNPILPPKPGATPAENLILGMGRLTRQKGFDLLIRAFAKARRGGWSLAIIGEGEERAALETLAAESGAPVRFLGRIADPASMLSRAGLFVLPSRFEGFPNALLEAMACGRAVIAADCASGPREIVTDGRDGLLVPPENVDALADSMGRLMDSETERERLGRAARAVTDRFSLEKVSAQWERLFERLIR